MFASIELSPPENLNIPPIQIPPTECHSNPRLIPLLGTPPPQRRQKSFTFPVLATATATATATTSIESAASILLSMASASPLAPPNKCRRVGAAPTSFIDYCRVCEISLLNVTPGIYADVCKSCESIQHRFRNGISFPACMFCSTDAYHIHRNCKQAICKPMPLLQSTH